MILSNGKNNFTNNEFSYWEWSAPIMQTHEEVIAKIKELNLQGRVIKSFYTVGMGYNWNEDDIGDAIYNVLQRKIKDKLISPDGPFPFLPEGVYISRFAEIDEPFLIEFEDGDILGVDYSEGSSVRMDMNTIQKDINFGTNRNTFHPNVLFGSLIGKEVVAVEVTTSTECDDFTWSHGLDISEQDSYITKISIVCRKDREWEREKLEFSSTYDYGIVALTDHTGTMLKIHAPDIKEVVKGFIAEETFDLQDVYHFGEEDKLTERQKEFLAILTKYGISTNALIAVGIVIRTDRQIAEMSRRIKAVAENGERISDGMVGQIMTDMMTEGLA